MLCSSWARNDAPLITANQSNGSLDLRDGIEASESGRNEAVPPNSPKWLAGEILGPADGFGAARRLPSVRSAAFEAERQRSETAAEMEAEAEARIHGAGGDFSGGCLCLWKDM